MLRIREECNKLVYQWKREYQRCVENNKELPKPITIPQIAKRADIAPKTIYTNSEYKRVALIAISKTKPCSSEEEIDFYPDKDVFKRDEVKIIAKSIIGKFESRIMELTKTIMEKTYFIEKHSEEVRKLEIQLDKHAILISELENENALLKGQIELLNKAK